MADGGSIIQKQLKVLVCGDVNGKFKAILSKVKSVNAKAGPFDLVLCVGNFYRRPSGPTDVGGEDDDDAVLERLKSNSESMPVPTFVLSPCWSSGGGQQCASSKQMKEGFELAPNLICLGHHGVMRTNDGLVICYLSGVGSESSESTESSSSYCHTSENVTEVRDQAAHLGSVDILITSDWPQDVTRQCKSLPQAVLDMQSAPAVGSVHVAELASVLRPRYHFSGLHNVHWERQPYRNGNSTKDNLVTRFISLAHVSNVKKQKWIYAFNIVPASKYSSTAELCRQQVLGGTTITDSPYGGAKSLVRPVSKSDQLANQFFYDKNARLDNNQSGKKRKLDGSSNKRPQSQPTGPCWFCLSGAQVEKHLIVSIGESAYMALAKGGLTEDHLLIMPVAHYASWLDLPTEVDLEINKFKTALVKAFASVDKDVVFFERNYRTQHLQLQVVPVPKAKSLAIESAFEDAAVSAQLEIDKLEVHDANIALVQLLEPGRPFFRAELPSGRQLIYRIGGAPGRGGSGRVGFPLNFGRMALAHDKVLNMADRVDWRACGQDRAEEEASCKRFRSVFQPFDFTLEDDDDDDEDE